MFLMLFCTFLTLYGIFQLYYSLRPILPFANTDVSSTKMCLDTSVFAEGNMGWKEYHICGAPESKLYRYVMCISHASNE
jgi:hypothetical protein